MPYLHVDNAIRLLEHDLPVETANAVKHDLTVVNPKWEQQERFGRRKTTAPQHLHFFTTKAGVLILPRGYMHQLRRHLGGESWELVDRTRRLDPVDFDWTGTLHPYQRQAVGDMLARRFGVLEAPPGAGKTVMALAIIHHRAQPALVIVHTKELMYQWRERACTFLGLDEEEIGLYGDGHRRRGDKLTIGIINSIYPAADELKGHIGHLIVDECHHTPARTFTDAVSLFDASFMLGLSATPYRRDRLTRMIYAYLGPRLHQIQPRQLQKENHIMRARLMVRPTGRRYHFDVEKYQKMISNLTADPGRNRLIADDVADWSAEDKGLGLVISDRVGHCEDLYERLCRADIPARLLVGATPPAERARIVQDMKSGEARILVATAQLIGEGFDLPALSAIFLAVPVSFSGRVKQYIGRILRVADGKTEAVIYDYVDENTSLMRSFQSRLHTYHQMGVTTDPDTAPDV